MNHEARQAAKDCAAIIRQLPAGIINVQTAEDAECTWLGKRRTVGEALRLVCAGQGIDMPTTKNKYGFSPVAARLLSAEWWTRKVKVAKERQREHVHIKAMHKQVQSLKTRAGRQQAKRRIGYKYVSGPALAQHRENKARLKAFIEATIAVCDDGDVMPLQRIAAASISNPVCRRAELMTRIRGFEDWAKLNGHECLFFTVTCPSRFHANSARYSGDTPKQAQAYLCDVWAKVRAILGKRGVKFYGFRVTEPHRDGTPHWHLLLWFNTPEDADTGRRIIESYYLADTPDERGAAANRVKTKPIDMKEGSAVGYVAKYIAKNVDGLYSDGKTTFQASKSGGLDAVQVAERVLAYASLWRVRQFQQVGGPKVGVWRELRALRSPEGVECLKTIGAAALKDAVEAKDWAAFIAAAQSHHLKMWADTSKTLLQALELEYGDFDAIPADRLADLLNQWGEPEIRRQKGLIIDGHHVKTRTKKWTILKRPKEGITAHVPAFGTRLEIVISKTFDEQPDELRRHETAIWESIAAAKRAAREAFAFQGQSPPWTRGNNCNSPPEAAGKHQSETRGTA